MKLDLKRVFILTGLISLGLIYPLLWARMIVSPTERTASDYMAFYAAGRVARQSGWQVVYDPALQQAIQEEVVGFPLAPGQVLLYNHIPFLLPLVALVAGGGYVSSFHYWVLLLIGLYAVSAGLAQALLQRAGWGRPERWLAVAGLLTFFPAFVSLLNGQDSAFTALGGMLWLAGLLTRRDPLAGVGLALVSVRPQLALFLAIPFLFQRRKVLGWAIAAAALLALFSLLLLGRTGTLGFLDSLRLTVTGEWFGMNEAAMVNLVGLLTRLLPGLPAGILHACGWSGYALALVATSLVWVFCRPLDERHIALAVLLALFFSPHLHYHDLALLAVPLVCLMLVLVRGAHLPASTTALLPLGASLALLLAGLLPWLKYNAPFLVMLLLAAAAFYPGWLLGWTRRKNNALLS